jgi:hypothetical protein
MLIKNRYKKFIIISTLFMSFLNSSCLATDNTHDIALDLNIAGKAGLATCDSFARDLYQRITRSGGEATYIIYDWRNESRVSGRHAFIVYRDSKGRYWGMDNAHRQPKWLDGKAPSQWVSAFAGDVDSRLVYAHTSVLLAGCYANFDHSQLSAGAEADTQVPDYIPETGQALCVETQSRCLPTLP